MPLDIHPIGPVWSNLRARLGALKAQGFYPHTILDVGAYRGYWASVVQATTYPESIYTLVEADPECISFLSQTDMEYHSAVLDSSERDALFFKCQTGCGEGNSLFRENSPHPFGQTMVRTQTLDKLFAGRQFDLIKLDVQGAELAIIAGGREVVEKAHILILETQCQTYNPGAPLAHEVCAVLGQLGWRLYDVCDFHYTSRGVLNQVDFMFAKKDSPLFQTGPIA